VTTPESVFFGTKGYAALYVCWLLQLDLSQVQNAMQRAEAWCQHRLRVIILVLQNTMGRKVGHASLWRKMPCSSGGSDNAALYVCWLLQLDLLNGVQFRSTALLH
jgi:hypothetical protein